jgi:hypothetical protein
MAHKSERAELEMKILRYRQLQRQIATDPETQHRASWRFDHIRDQPGSRQAGLFRLARSRSTSAGVSKK